MCDVGIKSLLRSVRFFYRERLAEFTKARAFNHSNTAVEEMLMASIDAVDISQDLSYDDLAMAIRVLLNTISSYSRTQRRGVVSRQKPLHLFIRLPRHHASQQEKFKSKLEDLNCLMYSIKQAKLTKFLEDPANIFLLRYFARHDGLSVTDPN